MKNYLAFSLLILVAQTAMNQSLNYYLEVALQKNPDLKAAYFSFEAQLEKVEQVKFLANPNLSFGYFILPVETRLGSQQTKISLNQMFPWFGTLSSKQDVASLMAKAQFEQFRYKQALLMFKEIFTKLLFQKPIESIPKKNFSNRIPEKIEKNDRITRGISITLGDS